MVSCWSPRIPATTPTLPPYLLPNHSSPEATLAITASGTPLTCRQRLVLVCAYTTADASGPADRAGRPTHTNRPPPFPQTTPSGRLARPTPHTTPAGPGNPIAAWHRKRPPRHSNADSSP